VWESTDEDQLTLLIEWVGFEVKPIKDGSRSATRQEL